MIDRGNVIKGFEHLLNAAKGNYQDFVDLTVDFGEEIAALLKEQEAVEPRWTSIKERYPDKEGFYLVSADHGNYLPWIAEMKILCGVKGFCNRSTMPCIGAWMPLPEPYNRTDLKTTITQEGR